MMGRKDEAGKVGTGLTGTAECFMCDNFNQIYKTINDALDVVDAEKNSK